MGFKFSFKNSKIGITPDEPAQTPTPGVPVKREVKTPEANEDWSEKTASNWSEHSGFIEISKGADIAPPPRLDPRTVPRPAPPVHGLSPAEKNLAIGLVLSLGVVFGLYSNGVFSRKKHAPKTVAVQEEVVADEPQPVAKKQDVIVPPVATKNQPVIVPPERQPAQAPAQPVKH